MHRVVATQCDTLITCTVPHKKVSLHVQYACCKCPSLTYPEETAEQHVLQKENC